MPAELTLPTWQVVLMGVVTVLMLLDRLLIPSVRWALRRRANRAVEQLNERLKLHIQPFKMTRRQVLIDRLLFDPDVLLAVDRQAKETGKPREVVLEEAKRYAREIVPSFSAYAYFKFGTRWAQRLSQMLYRVRLGFSNDDALSKVPADASVVFVINHRSNMDYVLVTYMAATSSALSYAVGEWAQVWPLRNLIRSMGAYFIRRNSENQLYRRILARYVHTATQAGVVQAVFPEGGLSLDGRLRPPKLGLITYMVSGFDPHGARDVVFIPVGVNYDRVLEDRVLTEAGRAAEADGAAKARFRFKAGEFFKFLAQGLWLRVRGRWYRFGYACVSFGEPLSLRDYLAKRHIDFRTMGPTERNAAVADLGGVLMHSVGQAIPALPVSLVATAMRSGAGMADAIGEGNGPTAFELKGRVHELIAQLEANGAYIHIPREDREYAIEVGLRMLIMRRLVVEAGMHYQVAKGEEALLDYYANAIAHLLQPVASKPD